MDESVIEKEFRERNIPVTMQRIAVMNYLREHRTHPTVDTIYSDLKERYAVLSRATVYNTLETLVDAGLVLELCIDKEKAHYDGYAHHHHHFYCSHCHTIYDIDACATESCPIMNKKTVDGHVVENLLGYFYGTCARCRKGVSNA